LGVTVADFIHFYGEATFDKGNIAWPWYRYLSKYLRRVKAAHLLGDAKGVAIGAATVFGDGADAMNAIRREVTHG
jgi:hypothetical protein